MYDVAIIGAGPAGATLARLLGKSYNVLLVDRRPLGEYPRGNSPGKCCGGLLAPDAQKMVARLGLELPQRVLVGPQLFAVRTIDLQSSLERYYQRFYINMDREEFDRWLVSLASGGVSTRFRCSWEALSREKEGFLLTLRQHGADKEFTETARILVGADGAASRVRRQAFPQVPLPEKYIAIQEWVEAEETQPYFSSIFDPEITSFYAWTIPKGDMLLLGAALDPGKGAAAKFELLKEKLRRYGFAFGKPVYREGAMMLRPNRAGRVFTGSGGIALVGEAAGWISPSSAEGLSFALDSALMLGQVLLKGLEDFEKRYRRETMAMRNKIMLKNLKSGFMYKPLLRKMVMASGLQSMRVERE